MYYLAKEPYENVIPEIQKTNGEVIPEQKYIVPKRAIYKHNRLSCFYRKDFENPNQKYNGLKLYTCKTLRKIRKVQKATLEYCGEKFDIYDENGIVQE